MALVAVLKCFYSCKNVTSQNILLLFNLLYAKFLFLIVSFSIEFIISESNTMMINNNSYSLSQHLIMNVPSEISLSSIEQTLKHTKYCHFTSTFGEKHVSYRQHQQLKWQAGNFLTEVCQRQ